VAAVAAPLAHADGDPASDYLLGRSTFIPPDAGLSSADQARLVALLTGARRGGYTVRVAIVASRYDLGSVSVLDRKPRLYAHFLSQELRFIYKRRVLVVMPNGYGIANNGKPASVEQAVLDRLPLPGVTHGSALAVAAERAVHTLAAHAGVRIAAVPVVATHSSGDTTTRDRIVIAVGVAVLLLLAGGFTFLRRRRATPTT
jgi:hypothetical protein